MTTEFLNDWLLRCAELVDKYHPQLFWFDEWIERDGFPSYLKTFAHTIIIMDCNERKGWQLINMMLCPIVCTGVLDIERVKQADIRAFSWQSDDAVGYNSWGYLKGEHYKSTQSLADELIDTVSKNGNLLLNVGLSLTAPFLKNSKNYYWILENG